MGCITRPWTTRHRTSMLRDGRASQQPSAWGLSVDGGVCDGWCLLGVCAGLTMARPTVLPSWCSGWHASPPVTTAALARPRGKRLPPHSSSSTVVCEGACAVTRGRNDVEISLAPSRRPSSATAGASEKHCQKGGRRGRKLLISGGTPAPQSDPLPPWALREMGRQPWQPSHRRGRHSKLPGSGGTESRAERSLRVVLAWLAEPAKLYMDAEFQAGVRQRSPSYRVRGGAGWAGPAAEAGRGSADVQS